MSWIVLIIVILPVYINGQRILTPPNNYTGIIGESAEFKCHVELDVYQTVMSWEFNNDPVYIYQYAAIEYPKGPGKYIVSHTRKKDIFILSVKDLSLSDVGWYKCVVVRAEKSARLLVLEKPQIRITNSNPVEGSKAQYTCKAGFGRPSKENLTPQLQLYLNGQLLNGPVEEEIDSTGKYHQLTQVYEVTLEASMNGEVLTCDIGTSNPVKHVNVTTEMIVLYSVRNITYTPNRGQYEVNTVINCSADGSPYPHFLWDNIGNIGTSNVGQLLSITKEMRGKNNWRCTATNAFDGRSYQQFILAAFDVVVPEETETSNIDSWKMAVAVIVPSFIFIIFCLSVLFCCYHQWKVTKTSGTKRIWRWKRLKYEFIELENTSPAGSFTVVVFCGEDGRKWANEIRKICEELPTAEKKSYAVQTYSSLKMIKAKFKESYKCMGQMACGKFVIILTMECKAHVKKYVDSLNSYPAWFPKATIIIDLPASEFPDWFEKQNIKFIDIQKYDDIDVRKKISEALFEQSARAEETNVDKKKHHGMAVKIAVDGNKILTGSIAEGLAWAYFFNYINLIGPTIAERIEGFKKAQEFPKKLFLLLPASGYSCPKLEDADPAITSVGKLEPFIHQIAGNTRNYDTAVYEITVREQTYNACVEYCTPVFTLYEMNVMGVADVSVIEKNAQLHNFYDLLKRILNLRTSPQFCRDFQLVTYDDEKNFTISEILVKNIQGLEGEKSD